MVTKKSYGRQHAVPPKAVKMRSEVGLSGKKIGRFPLNPGYSRVIPHNEFGKKLVAEMTLALIPAFSPTVTMQLALMQKPWKPPRICG
jgi:hypothetical protein